MDEKNIKIHEENSKTVKIICCKRNFTMWKLGYPKPSIIYIIRKIHLVDTRGDYKWPKVLPSK